MSAMTAAAEAQPPLLSSAEIRSAEVQAWRRAEIREVSPVPGRHVIHSYFNACPESPDGRRVLFYTSETRDGQAGEIRVLERATGKETLLVAGVTTEDAHRAACQHWVAGGKKVAFHDFREGRWVAAVVDIATGRERVLAFDRQIGFGIPGSAWVPVYGPHWKQGEYRDLELVHAETGEIRTAVRVADVLREFGREVAEMVGEGEVSIFFPVMSPDGGKAMFKIARGGGQDDFRLPEASDRQGKFVYDLKTGQSIRFFRQWGHPSWSPDSTGLFEKGNVLWDLASGRSRACAPGSPSDHPSLDPSRQLFVTDSHLGTRQGGRQGEWGIVVGSLETQEFATIHRFDNTGGARSWRRNHPHPVFNADGKRLYFNVSEGPWTRLYVAELLPGS
jgi:Tol biopolymer transport system component